MEREAADRLLDKLRPLGHQLGAGDLGVAGTPDRVAANTHRQRRREMVG